MTKKREAGYHKDRYDKGYTRSLNGWPIRHHAKLTWLEWITDPNIQTEYVQGRIDGEKELRLTKLLEK